MLPVEVRSHCLIKNISGDAVDVLPTIDEAQAKRKRQQTTQWVNEGDEYYNSQGKQVVHGQTDGAEH